MNEQVAFNTIGVAKNGPGDPPACCLGYSALVGAVLPPGFGSLLDWDLVGVMVALLGTHSLVPVMIWVELPRQFPVCSSETVVWNKRLILNKVSPDLTV